MADLSGPNPEEINGETAHDAVDAGNPVKIGGKATSSLPTAVSSGDRVDAWFWTTGAQMVSIVSTNGTSMGVLAETSANAMSVGGGSSHDAVDAGAPLKVGGYAKAAAPADVSTDGDRVNAWFLRNGAQATALTAAGALVGGSASGIYAQGPSAADAAVTGNPLIVGGRGSTAVPTSMSADGDAVPLWTSLKGALNVSLVDTAGAAIATGVQFVHDVAAGATPQGTLIMGQGKATTPADVSADGDAVAIWTDLNGALNVILRDTAGAYVTPGGGTQYVEDVAMGAVGTPTGTLLLGRASAAVPTAVSADADAAAQWMSRYGVAASMLASSTGTLVGVSAETTANVLAVGGGVAHDAIDAGNPQKIGGYAKAAAPAAVQDGDRVNAWFGTQGSLFVALGPGLGSSSADTATNLVTLSNYGAGTQPLGANAPGFMWNGTSWDRVRGTAAGGTWVQGPAVADAAVAGNPILVGARGYQAVPTAMSADGDATWVWVDRYGRDIVAQKAGGAALTSVASSATSVTILAANTARLGATIVNESTSVLYLKFGATASAISYTVVLAPTANSVSAYYEVPYGYTGIIDGIWASANGSARVTEIT